MAFKICITTFVLAFAIGRYINATTTSTQSYLIGRKMIDHPDYPMGLATMMAIGFILYLISIISLLYWAWNS